MCIDVCVCVCMNVSSGVQHKIRHVYLPRLIMTSMTRSRLNKKLNKKNFIIIASWRQIDKPRETREKRKEKKRDTESSLIYVVRRRITKRCIDGMMEGRKDRSTDRPVDYKNMADQS
jgi:hypothetical protein